MSPCSPNRPTGEPSKTNNPPPPHSSKKEENEVTRSDTSYYGRVRKSDEAL